MSDEKQPLPTRPDAARHDCPDIGAVIFVWRPSPTDYHADFELYRADWSGDTVAYIDETNTVCDDIADVDPWLSGYVKWDGCVNFTLDESHLCAHAGVVLLGERFSRAYDLALIAAESGSFEDDIAAAKRRVQAAAELWEHRQAREVFANTEVARS